jgi:hypothetical protein
MRARVLCSLVGALIAAVALVSASGAATTKAQKMARIDVSTRASVIHYLRSVHVSAKHVVIERGSHNYAGARCPGKGWACATTHRTIVQIAKPGGVNRFVCRTSRCTVVQFAGTSHGIYLAGRRLQSTAIATPNNTAKCVINTTAQNQIQGCAILQVSSSANNVAIVYEQANGPSGLIQTAASGASITQRATGAANTNTACVFQGININGSTPANNHAPVALALEAHQNVTIRQDSLHGGNSAAQSATSGGACTGSAVTQSQTLSSTASSSGAITQNENKASVGPNMNFDVEQNQSSGFLGTAHGANTVKFEQDNVLTAIANTPSGPVTQVQASPTGGLLGAVNQDSRDVSTAVTTQNETQCEDAAKSGLTTCDKNDPDAPGYPLTQTQYGPEGVWKGQRAGRRRVAYSVHKSPGDSSQTGNGADSFTINQASRQDNDTTSGQSNDVSGGVNTAGNGLVTQGTTIQGAPKADVQAGQNTSVSGSINCSNGSSCTKTLSAPIITSKPTNPAGYGSTSFTFSNVDPTVAFVCSVDGAPFTACTTSHNGSGTFGAYSDPNVPSGAHTFSVKTKDPDNGNLSAAATYSWVITPPDPTIGATKPANPDGFGNSESISFSDTDASAKFKCSLDGAAYALCSSPVSLPALASGSHTFSVKAYDSTVTYVSNNDAHYSWVITPPDPTILTNPDLQSTSRDATFTYGDDDSTALFQCQLDGGGFSPCPSTGTSFSDLSLGQHTFDIEATDMTGTYFSTGSATYTWTVIPYLSFEASDDGSAGWSGDPGSAIDLTVGPDTGNTFAQVTLHNFEGIAISDLAEPTFTTDNYSAGSPRYYITLSNGDSLWGYPPNAGLNGSDFAWAINNGNTYEPWSTVQSAESGATVTGVLVIADGDQSAGTTDAITDLTFDGYDFNPPV